MKRLFVVGAATLSLSACAVTMTAAPPGPLQTDAGLAVDLQNSWTRIPAALNGATNGTVLTRHGVMLDRVDLLSIDAGKSIIKAPRNVDVPVFRAGMSELELVELVTASLLRVGLTDVRAENVRPHQFLGASGIRFNLVGKYSSGLNMRGDAALAVVNGKLNVILFVAPAAHYYDANAAEIEQLIQNARLSTSS
jgi:hypothetical protein